MSNFYGDLANSISDGGSDVSEVDPEEMAKMGDVDNLDSDLFGRPTSKNQALQRSTQKSSVIKSALRATSEEAGMKTKPKVTFGKAIEFDEADPLADLLSEEDDFFLEKKTKSLMKDKFKATPNPLDRGDSASSSPNRASRNTSLKSKDISTLFGLGDEEKPLPNNNPPAVSTAASTTKSSSDWLGLRNQEDQVETSSSVKVSIAVPAPPTVPNSRPITIPRRRNSIAFDDDDILSSMGFDEVRKNKNDVFASVKSAELKNDPERPAKDISFGNVIEPSTVGATRVVVEEKQRSKDSFGGFGGYTSSVGREPRRSYKGVASGIADPLGIFSTTTQSTITATTDSKRKENAPSTSTVLEPKKSPEAQIVARSSIMDPVGFVNVPKHEETSVPSEERESAVVTAQPSFLAAPAKQATVAASLPSWLGGTRPVVLAPDRLFPPADKRAAVVQTSEQLDAVGSSGIGVELAIGSLLEQQTVAALERQETQLQSAVQLQRHEERLSTLIHRQQLAFSRQEQQLQTLLDLQTERQRRLEGEMAAQQERIGGHIRALAAQPLGMATEPDNVATLREAEREIERLGTMLEESKEKHRGEVVALEGACKWQLEMHKAERANMEQGYQSRIARMEAELAATCEQHTAKLATLRDERLADLLQLRDVHRETVADLKNHQVALMAQVSARPQADTLDTLLGALTRSTHDIAHTQGRMSDQQQASTDARDAEARLQAAQVEALRDAMSRQREWSERERDKLLTLVTTLERQLNAEHSKYEEERWSVKQEAARVEGRLQAVERERERWQEQQEREREDIKAQRAAMLHERQQSSAQLEEQKLGLAAEKARLATLSRLQGDATHKTEAEMEAALLGAREARQEAECERERLLEERDAVAREARRLHALERDLTRKARDLDNMTRLAVDTRDEGVRALAEASERDRQQVALSASLQSQLADLKERQRRNAEESARLSRERLRLAQERTCSFCENTFEPFRHERPTSDKVIVDPKLVLLKLKMDEDIVAHNPESYAFTSYTSASK